MRFLPKTKIDVGVKEYLDKASNDELAPYLSELLEWVQDINWPVAPIIVQRLSESGMEIVPVLNAVLQGEDEIWKYNIIDNLITRLNPDVMKASMDEVVRIINDPTESEVREEVNQVAKDAMCLYSSSV